MPGKNLSKMLIAYVVLWEKGSMSSLIELQIWGRVMLLFIVTALSIVTTLPILLCWVLRQVLEGVPNSSLSLC